MFGAIGNTQLLAGKNGAAKVWYSPDNGDSWDLSLVLSRDAVNNPRISRRIPVPLEGDAQMWVE